MAKPTDQPVEQNPALEQPEQAPSDPAQPDQPQPVDQPQDQPPAEPPSDDPAENPALAPVPPGQDGEEREYKVVGQQPVYDTQPGGTFRAALPPDQEQVLIEGGAIIRHEE